MSIPPPPPPAPRGPGPRRHGCATRVLGVIGFGVIGFAAALVILALGPLAIVLAMGAAFIFAIARARI